MSGAGPSVGSVVKGVACQCLDALPQNPSILQNLKRALTQISGQNFAGLETVMGQYLLPLTCDATQTQQLVQYLREYWFDPNSPTRFFPQIRDVANIYGAGLLQTLNLSSSSSTTPPLPIDAYWLVGHETFEMLNFQTDLQVTLVIATPRPPVAAQKMPSSKREAWSTRDWDGTIGTRKIELPSRR